MLAFFLPLCYNTLMKLWIKTIVNEKVDKNVITYSENSFDSYGDALREICNELDIPSPIIMKSGYKHLLEFNSCKYKASDFIEGVDFDYMIVENCIEE